MKCRDCGNDFRWVTRNSTIKPKYCLKCHNKRLLSKSHFNSSKNDLNGKTPKYIPRQKSMLKSKKNAKLRAMDRADQWFSRWVRIKHGRVVSGIVVCKCYTCGNLHPAESIQCGHWQRRGYKATRYHEDNARPQCVRCNKWRSGEPERFEINLRSEITDLGVDELKLIAQSDFRDSEEFYREQADKYRKLVNELVAEKQIKKWW